MNTLHKTLAVIAFTLPFSAFAAGPAPINLGSAGNYTILAKTGVSTTGTTAVTGNIGLSPAAATYITGFALILPAAGAFSTSALVTGSIYAPGYADPTPANLTTAILDMQNAYTDGMGRAAGVTELGAGNIGGLSLSPGTYRWGTGVTIPSNLTLLGNANDVWIFQIAQNLNVSSAVSIILAGGAQAANVFWVVAGQTTIGTTAVFNGTILDQTAIVLNTGATLNGRALAQTAVTLDSSSVTASGASSLPTPVVTPTPTPTPVSTPTYTPVTTQTTAQTTTYTAQGQAITLGNGQVVYVNSNGAFTNAQGQAVSNNTVSSSATAQATPSASVFGQQVRAIAVNLRTGSKNNNVAILQQFLISQNKGSAALTLSKVGATAYFGEMTRAALAEYQASVGISPALGNFGPVTRGYISAH